MPRRRVAAIAAVAAVAAVAAAAATAGITVTAGCSESYAEADAAPPQLEAGDEAPTASDGASDACATAKLDSDPLHCGRCGHSCLGGACSAGRCQPFVIGTSKGEEVLDLALDGKRVLWLTSTAARTGAGHLYACPKEGCGAGGPTSLAPPDAFLGSLGSDGVTAYVSFVFGQRALFRIDGNTLTKLSTTTDRASVVELQVHDGTLFFFSLFEQPSSPGDRAESAWALRDGGEAPIASHDGPESVFELAVAGSTAFLSGYAVILRCKGTTCAALPAAAAGGVLDLATDGTSVYWVSETPPRVLRCAVDAPCTAADTVLDTAQLTGGRPLTVTHDHGALYVQTAGGEILGCDPARCAASAAVIAREPRFRAQESYPRGTGVTSDDVAVYWSAVDGMGPVVDAGGAPVEDVSALTYRIMKLAK